MPASHVIHAASHDYQLTVLIPRTASCHASRTAPAACGTGGCRRRRATVNRRRQECP